MAPQGNGSVWFSAEWAGGTVVYSQLRHWLEIESWAMISKGLAGWGVLEDTVFINRDNGSARAVTESVENIQVAYR